MKLLAFDTSSVACTAALQFGGQVYERHEEKAREHTRLLLPMIRALFDESGTSAADLDAIVLGNGPGSFIGMRIAASVAQGIAYGGGLDIVPVSSLAAVALQVFEQHSVDEVVVAQDAHMHEVYLGAYRRAGSDTVEPIIDETLHGCAPIESVVNDGAMQRVAAGAGWQRYPELLSQNCDRIRAEVDILYPRARYLLALGGRSLKVGNSRSPRDLSPAYLRQKVAQEPGSA